MRRVLAAAALLAALAAPAPGQGAEVLRQRGCMERHLREAIELNRARAPLYARLSAGASRRVSRRLIATERLALPLARLLDAYAERYQDAGIPVLCEDFVEMSGVAPAPDRRGPAPAGSFTPVEAGPLARRLRAARRAGGFGGTAAAADAEVARLAHQPEYHCMTRHMLESIRRVAGQAERYAGDADRLGVPAPTWISDVLLRLHLAALGESARLDRAAAPVQAAGVPIVCRDVPHIPPLAPRR